MRIRIHPRCRRGFTLVEVAIAIVIVAVGVVAVQGMVAASTRVTAVNDELQTAGMLGRAMHERCLNLDRAALLALNGDEFSPPLDSNARALTELANYKQRVDVAELNPRTLAPISDGVETGLLRVTVTVYRNNTPVIDNSRLIATTKQD